MMGSPFFRKNIFWNFLQYIIKSRLPIQFTPDPISEWVNFIDFIAGTPTPPTPKVFITLLYFLLKTDMVIDYR